MSGKKKIGRPLDPALTQRGKDWRKIANDLMTSNPRLTYSGAAEKIAKDKVQSKGYEVDTIRKQLTAAKMKADGYDL